MVKVYVLVYTYGVCKYCKYNVHVHMIYVHHSELKTGIAVVDADDNKLGMSQVCMA